MRKLDCQFGHHYYKEHQEKPDHSRVQLQGSRKIGCKAHIIVRTVTLYPDFKLLESETVNAGPQKLKDMKKEKLKLLQKSLTSLNYNYKVSCTITDRGGTSLISPDKGASRLCSMYTSKAN